MLNLSLIKLNLFSSFKLDMTVFHCICYQEPTKGIDAVWKIKRKLCIEKKEAASESYSWKIAVC